MKWVHPVKSYEVRQVVVSTVIEVKVTKPSVVEKTDFAISLGLRTTQSNTVFLSLSLSLYIYIYILSYYVKPHVHRGTLDMSLSFSHSLLSLSLPLSPSLFLSLS
jgi:hypothetical protein